MTTDITRTGSPEYTVRERRLVVDEFLRLTSSGKSTHVDELSRVIGARGRTARQIVVDRDGIDYLVGEDDGYTRTEWREEGDSMTRRLRATADSLMERVRRREQYALQLPVRQQVLL